MKLLFTEGIGASQTTTNAQDEKIPVYETKTAAENDLANLEVGQIIATKDEGSELSNPVDVVQDGNMKAVTSNAVADSLSYSANEVKTGGKWIDGKPIYRKVVNFGALPNATTKKVAHGVNNIGDITHIYGVAHSSAKMTIPLPYARGIPIILYATQDDVAIEISTNDYIEFTRSEITIEYTKTTD